MNIRAKLLKKQYTNRPWFLRHQRYNSAAKKKHMVILKWMNINFSIYIYIFGYNHHLHVLQVHRVYMHMDLSFWLSTNMTLCNTAWHCMTSHDIHMTLHYVTYIHGSVWTWGIHGYTYVSHQKFTTSTGEWSNNTYRFYLDKYMIILGLSTVNHWINHWIHLGLFWIFLDHQRQVSPVSPVVQQTIQPSAAAPRQSRTCALGSHRVVRVGVVYGYTLWWTYKKLLKMAQSK